MRLTHYVVFVPGKQKTPDVHHIKAQGFTTANFVVTAFVTTSPQ